MNSELTGRQYEQRSMPPSITDLFPMPNTQTDDVSMFHVEMNISQQHMAYDHENHTGTCNFNLSLHNGWYNTTIDLTLWEVANRYTIRLYAKDHAGNSITASLSKAWDAVKSAVDWIVDWVKGIIKELITSFLDQIKAFIKGAVDSYVRFVEFLSTLIQDTDNVRGPSEENSGGNDLETEKQTNGFIQNMVSIGMIIAAGFGVLMTGLMIAKAMTLGLGAVVSSVLVAYAKDIIISAVLGIALGETVGKILNGPRETNSTDLTEKLATAMGVSLEGAENVLGIITKAFTISLLKKGGVSLKWKYTVKYVAIAIALTSFLWAYVSPVIHGSAKYIGVLISGAGLVIYILDKLASKGTPAEEFEENGLPIANIIEWLLPIVGFIKAVVEVSR